MPASIAGPGQPPFTLTGNAGINVINLGPATVLIGGSGNQNLIGTTFLADWKIGAGTATAVGWIGQEISRVLVPEPSTALLLVGALGGLGLVGAGSRKMRR
jgi:hypothetical protein